MNNFKEVFNSYKTRRFTSYDFMCLFIGTMVSHDFYYFNRSLLLSFLLNSKINRKYNELLENIKVQDYNTFISSNDIDEAIIRLKKAGFIYDSIDTKGDIIIYNKVPISELIRSRVSYYDIMSEFVTQFRIYESTIERSNNSLYDDYTFNREFNMRRVIKIIE